MKKIIKAHVQKHFSRYKPGLILGLATACFVITVITSYSYFSYTPTQSSDLIVEEATFKSISVKRLKKKYNSIETIEFCGELTSHNLSIFDKESFVWDVSVGEKFIFKILKSDYDKLKACKQVELYSLQQGSKIYIDENDVFEAEKNNRSIAVPLVGLFFLFGTAYSVIGYIYMNKRY